MKKIKLLIPTIAIALPSVLIPLASCGNKDTTYIKEPTEAEKQIQAAQGSKKATFTWTLVSQAKDTDTFSVGVVPTNNAHTLKTENIKLGSDKKTLSFDVVIDQELIHTGSITIGFTTEVVKKDQAGSTLWDKTITNCAIKYKPNAISSITISGPDSVEYTKTSTEAFKITDYAPQECKINENTISVVSSNPSIIEVQSDNKLKAKQGSGTVTITVSALDEFGNPVSHGKQVSVTNTVTGLTISGEHNIDVDNATSVTLKAFDTEDTPREQTSNCTWSITQGSDLVQADSTTKGQFNITTTGKAKGGSVTIKAELGTNNTTFDFELGSFTKLKTTSLEAGNASTTTDATGLVVIPSRYYVGSTDSWIATEHIISSSMNNAGITGVHIGKNISDIGGQAFGSGLSTITVDSNNTTYSSPIGSNAIVDKQNPDILKFGCKGTDLTKISGLTTISNDAFFNSSLTSITIPVTVTTIGTQAFKGCKQLETITIIDNTTPDDRGDLTIGNYAFDQCKFTTITLPQNTKSIGNNAFSGVTGLTSILFNTIDESYLQWSYTNSSDEYCIWTGEPKNEADAGIHNKTFICGTAAILTLTRFKNNRMFTFGSLGGDKYSIEKGNLTADEEIVELPKKYSKGVGTIGEISSIPANGFSGLTSTKTIKFSNTITTLGTEILKDCKALSTIDFTAFNTTPLWTATNVFDGIASTAENKQIKVKKGLGQDWDTLLTTIWSTFKSTGWTITEVA